MTSYVNHNLLFRNSKTFRIYLTRFPLARNAIYEMSFGHNSKMWHTKIVSSSTGWTNMSFAVFKKKRKINVLTFIDFILSLFTTFWHLFSYNRTLTFLANFVTYIQQIVNRRATECEFVTP